MGNNSKEENDVTSYSFIASILLFIIFGLFIRIYKRLFYDISFSNEIENNVCKCSKCKERIKNYLKKKKKENINLTFFIYIIAIVILLYLFIGLCQEVANETNKNFNPYEILEISESANEKEIKKSYKKLSLKFHPDKSKEKNARDKFMEINKAYRALTNPIAKENYKKYGNPDGPGFIKIDLGLPKFLFKGKFANGFLIFIAISLVIIGPIWFLKWFNSSNQFNNEGLYIIDQSIFYYFLNEETPLFQIPFIIGLAEEFKQYFYKENNLMEKKYVEDLYDKYNKYYPNIENNIKEDISYGNKKAICILYSHFINNKSTILEENYEDLYYVFHKSIELLDNMINMVISCNNTWYFYEKINEEDKKTSEELELFEVKKYNLNTLKTLIKARQIIHQETNITIIKNEFLELPNITNEDLNSFSNIESIKDLKKEFNKVNNKYESIGNYLDKKEALKNIPLYDIKCDIEVQHYEVGDLLIFKNKIVRSSNDKNKKIGWCHSNTFPGEMNEKVLLIITNESNNKILGVSKLNLYGKKYEINYDYNMMTENEGKIKFNIEVNSLNYLGIDNKIEVEIEINKGSNPKLIRNFIKNRMNFVLSQNDFETNYLNPLPYNSLNKNENNENSHLKED